MAENIVEHVEVLHRFEPVWDLEVMVWETVAEPKTISVVILGADFGWSDVAQIDKSDPGARAISLAEIIHNTLQSAECAWFAELPPPPPHVAY
jgi:hypothetical protein